MKESPKTVTVHGVETRAQRYTQPPKEASHLGRKALALFTAMGIGVAVAPHASDVGGSVYRSLSMSETDLMRQNSVSPADAPKPHNSAAREAGVTKAEEYLRQQRQAQEEMARKHEELNLGDSKLRVQ